MNLFKEAKSDFDQQFPMIQFATAGEETTVDLPLMKNSTYIGTISLISDFGPAKAFTKMDGSGSLLTFKPDETHVREYKVKITLTDGVSSYEKTMLLSVLASEESKANEETKVASPTEEKKDLFILPEQSKVTVKLNDRLEFVAQDYI